VRDDSDQFTWTGDFKANVARMFAEAYAEELVYGDGTGEPRGILGMIDLTDPSPAERAFAILEPHLRACPLYDAGAPVIYPWRNQP
jgi:hypothetical protein